MENKLTNNLNIEDKLLVRNLLLDKIDLSEKHIKRLKKDYKYYTEERINWIPDTILGSPNSNYAKELLRQISIEEQLIVRYNLIIEKIMSD